MIETVCPGLHQIAHSPTTPLPSTPSSKRHPSTGRHPLNAVPSSKLAKEGPWNRLLRRPPGVVVDVSLQL